MSDIKIKEYLTELALQEEKSLPESKNKVIFNKIFLAFTHGDTSITLPSRINKSTKLYTFKCNRCGAIYETNTPLYDCSCIRQSSTSTSGICGGQLEEFPF